MKSLSIVALALILCGCATKTGRWYPVFGFGWITVSTNQPAVTTTKTIIIGAGATTSPLSAAVGFSEVKTISAATNSNVILELK